MRPLLVAMIIMKTRLLIQTKYIIDAHVEIVVKSNLNEFRDSRRFWREFDKLNFKLDTLGEHKILYCKKVIG
jgi:hypothetical protein